MTRKKFLTLGLLAVLLLSACTPTASAPTIVPTSGAKPAASAAELETAPSAAPVVNETETSVEAPQAMPTSRGSQLVATDPSTVNLTSGKPQLIEFFAFW